MFRNALGSRPRTALTTSAAAVLGGCYYYYNNSNNPSTPPLHSALQPHASLACPLVSRETLTSDTARFRFALPSEEHSSGLTTASHVLAVDNSMGVSRAYTPVSAPDTKGHFDLLIKRYPNGEFSTAFHKLKLGDSMDFRGPVVTLDFERPNVVKYLCLVAGGTGITPMYQIVNKVLSTEGDRTEVRLLYANKSIEDVLLKKELDALMERHPGQFRVHYVVEERDDGDDDQPPIHKQQRRSWLSYLVPESSPSRNNDDNNNENSMNNNKNNISTGRIDSALVQEFLIPATEQNAAVLVCGPEGMLRFLCGNERNHSNSSTGARSTPPLGGLLGSMGYGRRVIRFTDHGV